MELPDVIRALQVEMNLQGENLTVDGVSGPETRRALLKYAVKVLLSKINERDTPWMQIAEKYIGQHEIVGLEANPFILECFKFTSIGDIASDEVPWCAAFVCRVLSESGFAHTHSASAISYANYGEACELRPGAIAVKKREGGAHVTFIKGMPFDGMVECLGGNQANSVCIETINVEDFIAFRWPVKQS